MKTYLKQFLIIGFIFIMFININGCSNKKSNNDNDNNNNNISKSASTNNKYDPEKMVTLDGTEIQVNGNNNIQVAIDSGFGYVMTEQQLALNKKNKFTGMVNEPYSIMDSIVTERMVDFLEELHDKELSDEELVEQYNKLKDMQVFYQGIFRYTKDDKESKNQYEQFKNLFETVEELVTLGKDTYYYGYNEDFSKYQITDEEKKILDKLVADREDFKNNIIVFPIKINFDGNMANFETTNLNGETVTQDIFKDYDVTMVNIWATWCGFCVDEFPELQKLYEQLPENVNMITVCDDAKDNLELAKKMVDDVSAEFKVLIPDENIKNNLLQHVQALPTTIFLDKNGNAIGKELSGVPSGDDIATEYLKIIKERLAVVSK